MARQLTFEHAGVTYDTPMEKVDRRKLYGWVEKRYYDANGDECHFGTITADGTHILGRASLEQGYLDRDGDWVERGDLVAVDEYGDVLEKQESSFKAPIRLDEKVSVDDYLLYIAKSVYQLDAAPALIAAVRADDEIFVFPFNYVASLQPDEAFLIENEGVLFMVVGEPTGFDYVGLEEVEATLLIEDEEEEEEADIMDFGMM